ncbi:MAG TPA: beta-ketoacyl synthase N-terminal-like domain-containing protein [Bacteroidales bacterium]|nr:beta-ketoacyl synthase N-terminal-like domain-containing protein [Bacteroidales bacterium]
MEQVYIASDNIISSLGFTTSENAVKLKANETGIALHTNDTISPAPFWASMVDRQRLDDEFSILGKSSDFTLFEKFVIWSVKDALTSHKIDPAGERVMCILSTTKGNVGLLKSNPFEESRVYLWNTALILQKFFNLKHKPVIVSNACISGVLAISAGARMIRSGRFDHVIITGADIVTEFVLSGFNSFLSLCQGPCKPFDAERNGLSLGEAAGTLVITRDKNLSDDGLIIDPGFTANDANHISGPSRTGEGLYIAIDRMLKKSGKRPGYVSAHGTATPYNDEMESIALTRAGMADIPVNSLKGYWGHTLGAAGLIETIAGINSMREGILYKTYGFSTPGVTNPINVIVENIHKPVGVMLKIASGFGGSNASLLISRS